MKLTAIEKATKQECIECDEPATFLGGREPLCRECAAEAAEDELLDMLENGAGAKRLDAFFERTPEQLRGELKKLAADFNRLEDA